MILLAIPVATDSTAAGAKVDAAVKADGIELKSVLDSDRLAQWERGEDQKSLIIPIGTAKCFETDAPICVADRTVNPPPAEPGAPTISDLAGFAIAPLVAHAQPNGWAAIDRPANFYTTGGTHTVTGTLLGKPATVRFTPTAWYWDYGDGHTNTTTTTTGGYRWRDGKEFTDTATSHRYEQKADYTVRLLVDYTAEYQYDGAPWNTVPGAIRVPSNDLTILTWYVSTRLVSQDCIDNPNGIGCNPTR